MNLIVCGNGAYPQCQGHLINTMDTVIRLSNFQTKGYEALVGTKTDIVSVARIENLDPMPPKVWIGNPAGFSTTPVEIVKKAYPTEIIIPSKARIDTICEHYEVTPTLGSLTIWLVYYWGRGFYDKIYVTGFDFGHVGRCDHYYNDKKFSGQIEAMKYYHSPANERMVLKNMIAEGKVEMLDMHDLLLLEEGYSLV